MRLAAFLLLVCASQVSAQAPEQPWYAGVSAGVVVSDDAFRRDGSFYSAVLGKAFSERYALELELFQDQLDFSIDYGLKHQGFALNHRTVNRDPLWNPYFLIGVGRIDFDSPVAPFNGNDWLLNIGIGGEWELVVPNRILLRADLRLRYDLTDSQAPGQDGFGDGIFTLGLIVPFGANSGN